MSVVSLEFYALLFVTVVLLAAAPPAWRGTLLLGSSLTFYLAGDPLSGAVGLAIIAINFLFLRVLIGHSDEATRARIYLATVCFNLAVFVGLKLVFESGADWGSSWRIWGYELAYPLGLSFIMPMLHAALSGAYSEQYVPRARVGTYFAYATFFPYVTSGPVERLGQMEEQLDRPAKQSWEDLRAGSALIGLGLVKKLVVANRLGPYVDAVFAGDLPHSAVTVAFAIALNALHLYCDFSGYTDIARGAARCLGIDIRINFDRPFASRSITEFWRRWHISFSSWLRDYIFMPLAFALRRAGAMGATLAIVVTFVAAGFWHRAVWTYVLFGLFHGLALALEMRFGRQIGRRLAVSPLASWEGAAGQVYTLLFVGLTIVLFSADDLTQAGTIVARAVTSPLVPWPRELFGYLGPFLFVVMIGGVAVWQVLERWHERLSLRATPAFLFVCATLVLFLGSTGPGFIYEQF